MASGFDEIWIPSHLRGSTAEGVHALSKNGSRETESAYYVARRVHEEEAIDGIPVEEETCR